MAVKRCRSHTLSINFCISSRASASRAPSGSSSNRTLGCDISNEEARSGAEKLIQYVTPELAAGGQQKLSEYDSEGQRRMLELQAASRDGLWLRPDLWAGVGMVRGGAGTAMVGDGATVAALMHEYASLGIHTFILSGYPHLEESYHFAEHVFPRLALGSPVAATRRGEFITNGAVPLPETADTARR